MQAESGACITMISFDNLWKVMKERGISQYSLIKDYHISPGQITRLKRNESVSTPTIAICCRILPCSVGAIMECIEDEPTPQTEIEKQLNDLS